MACGRAKAGGLQVVNQLPPEVIEAQAARRIDRVAVILGRLEVFDRLVGTKSGTDNVPFSSSERNREQQFAARFQDPGTLGARRPEIGNVLEDFERDDMIDALIAKRKRREIFMTGSRKVGQRLGSVPSRRNSLPTLAG